MNSITQYTFFPIALGVPSFIMFGYWVGGSFGGAISLLGVFMGFYNAIYEVMPFLFNYIVLRAGTIVALSLGYYLGMDALMLWVNKLIWLPRQIIGGWKLLVFSVTLGCLLGIIATVLSLKRKYRHKKS